MARHAFTLFVTGDTDRSRRAVAAFRDFCERYCADDFELTVVDVLLDAELAEQHNVIATPVVIRTSPPPPRRALGDLGDTDRVAAALGMHETARPDRPDRPDRADRADRADRQDLPS